MPQLPQLPQFPPQLPPAMSMFGYWQGQDHAAEPVVDVPGNVADWLKEGLNRAKTKSQKPSADEQEDLKKLQAEAPAPPVAVKAPPFKKIKAPQPKTISEPTSHEVLAPAPALEPLVEAPLPPIELEPLPAEPVDGIPSMEVMTQPALLTGAPASATTVAPTLPPAATLAVGELSPAASTQVPSTVIVYVDRYINVAPPVPAGPAPPTTTTEPEALVPELPQFIPDAPPLPLNRPPPEPQPPQIPPVEGLYVAPLPAFRSAAAEDVPLEDQVEAAQAAADTEASQSLGSIPKGEGEYPLPPPISPEVARTVEKDLGLDLEHNVRGGPPMVRASQAFPPGRPELELETVRDIRPPLSHQPGIYSPTGAQFDPVVAPQPAAAAASQNAGVEWECP